MKTPALFLIIAVSTLCVAEQYTDRYDHIDVEEIVENRRLLTPYVKCVLDQGRCTPEGKELKLHIQEAIQTGCEKCTQIQRKNAKIVVKHIRAKETDYWNQIKNKFDPKDQYKEIYERFIESKD